MTELTRVRRLSRTMAFFTTLLPVFIPLTLALVWLYIDALIPAALSVLLSMNNPLGQRVLALNISSDDIALLFISGVFIIVTWISAFKYRDGPAPWPTGAGFVDTVMKTVVTGRGKL